MNDLTYFLIHALNGLQYGLILFLIASGLTILFGIMGVINLAHGSFYMLGAYVAAFVAGQTGSLLLAILLVGPLAIAFGWALEWLIFRHLYDRDHLQQVLLTFALIMLFNEIQSLLFGNLEQNFQVPQALSGSIALTETLSEPIYHLVVAAACLALAGGLVLLINRTRLGMLIRAGAANREMVQALGFDIRQLYAAVFALGTALAAIAGALYGPMTDVSPGMGERVLITCFVVVVIGGIGSIRGAFIGALLIGLTQTYTDVYLPELAGAIVYVLMAGVLLWRPAGLFGRAI